MKKIDDAKTVSYVIKAYVEDKKSMNKISKELNISDSTVKRILVDNNIEVKKRNLSYTVDENLFSKIENEEDAYWLGFMYADGNVKVKGNGISLDLKEEDKYLLEKFRAYCKLTKPLRIHITKRNNKEYISYCCDFSNEKIKENLIKLGCIPNKSLVLKCPTEEQVPQSLFTAFVRGYCDGDGYVRWEMEKNIHREICLLGTKDFLTGVVERMKWQNFAYVYPDKSSKAYRLSIYQKLPVYEVLKQLYDTDLCLTRKKEVFLKAQQEMQPM